MTIQTLRQHALATRARIRARHPEATRAEVARAFPDICYEGDWMGVLHRVVGAGEVPSLRVWRSLAPGQRHRLLRDLTRTGHLRGMSPVHAAGPRTPCGPTR